MIKVPLNKVTFNEDEIQSAIEVLKSGFVTMGTKCLEFEAAFAKHMKVKHAVFVNSGSSANLLAFFALSNAACPQLSPRKKSLAPGSEVIVPAVTWSTTIWPVVQAGLIPVIVDSDPETLQVKPEYIEEAIGPKTSAACMVHVLGNSLPIQEIKKITDKHDLWLVEDTCEALGTKFDDKFVGTFGDVGTFSFFFSHHITTIEGGMLVTDNDELADLFRCMRAHGWTRHMHGKAKYEKEYSDIDPRFLFINTGFNLRPTEINAAFGVHQLKKLSGFNESRVEIANRWVEEFAPLIKTKAFVPMRPTDGSYCTWFGFPVICESKKLRDELQAHLEKNGIETRPIICGNLVRQPAFKNISHRIVGKLDGANKIMDQGLFWGSHPVMSEQEIQHVVTVVKGFFA